MFPEQLKPWALLMGFMIFFLSSIAMAKPSEGNIQTPLMNAAYEGDTAAMKRLLEQGVNADQTNNLGLTALYYAAGATRTSTKPGGSVGAIRVLLDKGAKVNARSRINGFNALMAAVENENVDSAALLLKYKADANAVTKDGRCALGIAAGSLDSEMVNLLLAYHANVNSCKDINGRSPLFNTIEAEPSLTEIFAMARLNHQQELDEAIKREAPEIARARMIVRSLIAQGADVNVSDNNGRTPLSLAVLQSNHLIVKELLDAGANANVPDKGMAGASPLILAAQIRNVTIAVMLLQHGAKVNARDKLGKSALDYARISGPSKMVGVLQDELKN